MSGNNNIFKKVLWSILTLMLIGVLIFMMFFLKNSKKTRVIEKEFKNIVLLIADEADKFNDATVTSIPSTLRFVVKSSNSAMGNRMFSTIANLKGSS